jgi:hypothetical protein
VGTAHRDGVNRTNTDANPRASPRRGGCGPLGEPGPRQGRRGAGSRHFCRGTRSVRKWEALSSRGDCTPRRCQPDQHGRESSSRAPGAEGAARWVSLAPARPPRGGISALFCRPTRSLRRGEALSSHGPVFHIAPDFHIGRVGPSEACWGLEELGHGADSGHANAVGRGA